jgi:hypothetical protein
VPNWGGFMSIRAKCHFLICRAFKVFGHCRFCRSDKGKFRDDKRNRA